MVPAPDFDLGQMYRYPANYRDADLMRAAEERGWERSRQRGSHVVYSKPGWPDSLSIPVGVKRSGTKRAIIRQLQEAERA